MPFDTIRNPTLLAEIHISAWCLLFCFQRANFYCTVIPAQVPIIKKPIPLVKGIFNTFLNFLYARSQLLSKSLSDNMISEPP